MPKPALIADPAKREIVIAVVMGVILLASLLITLLVTGAPVFQLTATPGETPAHAPHR
ncbi:MAG: hypothetical protein ACIAXF_04535 [Phycisphaerales bacterium JB063]